MKGRQSNNRQMQKHHRSYRKYEMILRHSLGDRYGAIPTPPTGLTPPPKKLTKKISKELIKVSLHTKDIKPIEPLKVVINTLVAKYKVQFQDYQMSPHHLNHKNNMGKVYTTKDLPGTIKTPPPPKPKK